MDMYDALAEDLYRLVSGGDPSPNDSNWKIQELRVMVAQCHNQMILNDYKYNESQEGIHNVGGQFITEFKGLPVVTDSVRKEKYVQLTSNFVNLPGGKGISEVYVYDPNKRRQVNFSFIPAVTASLMRGLWMTSLLGEVGYRLEGDRIYFVEEGTNMRYSTVNFKFILGNPNSVGADQEMMILSMATQMIAQRQGGEDKTNDNNATR